MRILKFQIKNFRNIRFAECNEVPDFMVICGGNGCGKSSLLEALMTAKESCGTYYNFQLDRSCVSANAEKSNISLEIAFLDKEREFAKKYLNCNCPEKDVLEVEITKLGERHVKFFTTNLVHLLRHYSAGEDSPGYFDYITAHRRIEKTAMSSWNAELISDENAKRTFVSENKFQQTKNYLASLEMNDLHKIKNQLREGKVPENIDSLKQIKDVFNRFFNPLKFKDIYLDKPPFRFVIDTPSGEIDIDELSSGEKEIFNIFVRFHQLHPNGSVILFDEADAHLHPDLDRRYLLELKEISKGNQVILTTHSPEMMIAAGSESLYTLIKNPIDCNSNQLVRVTQNDSLHEALSEIMGSRGIVSFNQKIVFIEGEYSSTDREIYEKFYPPEKYNISFVPAGNSCTVRSVAARVSLLLSSSMPFHQYFCIVDGDLERSDSADDINNLYRLPVYHVENYLLAPELILKTLRQYLGSSCSYQNSVQVEEKLKLIFLSEMHVTAFSKAYFDCELAKIAKCSYDAIYTKNANATPVKIPDFQDVRKKVLKILENAIVDTSWKKIAKGRELLRALCGEHNINYLHFKNSIIANFECAPSDLQCIMDNIINN